MSNHLELGAAPGAEDCVQVSPDGGYLDEMRRELERFKRGLEHHYAHFQETGKIRFTLHWQSHDFGRYGEIRVCFDGDDHEARSMAYAVDNNVPATWNELENGTFNPATGSAQTDAVTMNGHYKVTSVAKYLELKPQYDKAHAEIRVVADPILAGRGFNITVTTDFYWGCGHFNAGICAANSDDVFVFRWSPFHGYYVENNHHSERFTDFALAAGHFRAVAAVRGRAIPGKPTE